MPSKRLHRKDPGSSKQFGKLSADQVVEFFESGRAIVSKQSQLTSIIAEGNLDYSKLFPDGPSWVPYYHFDFQTLTALVLEAIGALHVIHNIDQAPDPQAAALSFQSNFDPALLGRGEPTKEQFFKLIPRLVALDNCWKCVSYYSVTMCEVYKAARQGRENALIVAASIDPAIFWASEWRPAIAAASIDGNREFFQEIGKYAFRINKKREQSRLLRVLEFVLRDAGAIGVTPKKEILDLVVGRLGMRSDLGENPEKALSQLFRRCSEDRAEILNCNHANS